MSEENYSFDNPMHITIEQSKLVASAIRTQIIEVIWEEPHTAKQVADALKKTPGNIHYHIQRLYEGGLIDLVKTREVSGVVEKYYKSKSRHFTTDAKDGSKSMTLSPDWEVEYRAATRMNGRLMLSEQEKRELLLAYNKLFEKYVARVDDPEIVRTEFAVRLEVLEVIISEENIETEVTEEEGKQGE